MIENLNKKWTILIHVNLFENEYKLLIIYYW